MRRRRLLAIAALTGGLAATVALAFGHVARFQQSQYQTREGAGSVRITVERDGPSGEGTIDYETVNATARAGRDYVAANGTLAFADGDFEKSFTVRILNDSADEPAERFRVRLSNPTGVISVLGGPATVTIADNDPTPRPTTPTPSPTEEETPEESPSPSPEETATPSPEESPSPSPEESPSPPPGPSPTASPTPLAGPPEEGGGLSGGAIAGIVGGVLLALGLGGGIRWLLRRPR